MKNIIYIKKLKFHNLFTGKITYKLHINILWFSFRIPYWFKKEKSKDLVRREIKNIILSPGLKMNI